MIIPMERGKRFKKQDIFSGLVYHHTNYNLLTKCINNIVEGRVIDKNFNTPFEEGEENTLYKGVLIFADGETLAEKLLHDEVLKSKPEAFQSIDDIQDFDEYFTKKSKKDGAFIYDSVNNRITRSAAFTNEFHLEEGLNPLDMIPEDFIDSSGKLYEDTEVGTKTRLAIELPHAYDNVDAFQIKMSGYTELGMGKVTHFNKQGLVEEFFFDYNRQLRVASDDPRDHIQGVYRQYERDEKGKLIRVVEERFGLDELDKIKDICYQIPQADQPSKPAEHGQDYSAQCA